MAEDLVKSDKKKASEDKIIDRIQAELDKSKNNDTKIVDKVKEEAIAKIANVRDFQEYFRPMQERRTLLWNELGVKNSYDILINVNAGKPDVPAKYSQTITLYYNDPSREQMQNIEELRGKSQDLDRIERLCNTLPMHEIEKRGFAIPKNYTNISMEAAKAKEELLIARIIMFCGVEKNMAENIADIAHSNSLDDILDSWEYRARVGFPNLNPGSSGTQNISYSG